MFCFKVSSDLKNIDTEVIPKAKSHVTIRRAVLEEIGNKVRNRTTQVAKVTRTRWHVWRATLYRGYAGHPALLTGHLPL
jgi:hypothetical protein